MYKGGAENGERCHVRKVIWRAGLVQPEHREGLDTAANQQPYETLFGFDGLATLHPLGPALEAAKVKLGAITHDATSRERA